MNTIIRESPPSLSMSLKLGVSVGRNQIQRNVGNYSALYVADAKQVSQDILDLPAGQTWSSNPQSRISGLVLSVSGDPVTVTSTKLDDTTVVLVVKRLLVIDEDLKGFSITNSGTTAVRASANYITYLA